MITENVDTSCMLAAATCVLPLAVHVAGLMLWSPGIPGSPHCLDPRFALRYLSLFEVAEDVYI